ncbi:peptidoglycan-binding protein [Isoptericola sp. NPDC056605]|uniref:peptidoglycan-binding protein n=1 Tax=Isoptericola sp. NPDC056605 TaxID=3345876 RepID=UPI0036B7357F
MAQIARSDTIPLETQQGHRLEPASARAFDALVRAYRAEYGEDLDITDSFRPRDVQERIFRDRYRVGNHAGEPGFTRDVRYWNGQAWTRRAGTAAAAVPGTSNHGAGTTVDITGTGGFGGTVYKRLQSLAPKYGFTNDEGRRVDESWHWGRTRSTSYPKTPTYEAGWPVLYPGDQGDDVKALQRELIQRGYDLGTAGADGDFGETTTTAVKAFQRSADLTPDARVGTGTQKALTETKDWFDMATKKELEDVIDAYVKSPAGRKAIAEAVWNTDGVLAAPADTDVKKNPHWGAASFLSAIRSQIVALRKES